MNIKVIIKEIRTRSIWQIVGIYLVAGWGAFEAVTSLTETAGLPEWFPAASLSLLILFLPVVLAISFIGTDSSNEITASTSEQKSIKDDDSNKIKSSSVNWRIVFMIGASVMILLTILGVIFFPTENSQIIQRDINSDNNISHETDANADIATVNLLSNIENLDIKYFSLNDNLSVKNEVTTEERSLNLNLGQYAFEITSNGFNNLAFNIDVNEKKIYDVEINLIESNDFNNEMQMISTGFLSADETGAIIKNFMMDKFEVTNKDYANFIASGGYENQSLWNIAVGASLYDGDNNFISNNFLDKTNLPAPRNWSGSIYPEGQGDTPVTDISWFEADAFCRWQNKKLPSSNQWWRAALGENDYLFPWGNDMNNLMKRANFESQKAWEASDENIYGASIFGVFDLAGNVSEWLDIEQNNTSTSQIVGGSWQDSSYIFDISINEYLPLTFHSSNVGFRCVK